MKEEAFKNILDSQHTFPGEYLFKFISPQEKKNDVIGLFPREKVKVKQSSKGNYISVTVNLTVKSSDEVMDVYSQIHKIGEVIAL